MIFRKFKRRRKSTKYIGNLDKIEGLTVYGWAYNKENPNERVEVVVLVDGKPVAEGIADKYREDLKQAGIGDGKHAFEIKIPQNIYYSRNAKVVVAEKNTMSIIGESIIKRTEKFDFFIDILDSNQIAGWAAYFDKGERKKVEIEIYKNGVLIGRTKANMYRKDLKDAGIGDGFFGFNFFIPEHAKKDVYTSKYEFVIKYNNEKKKTISGYGFEFIKPNQIQEENLRNKIIEAYHTIITTLKNNEELIPYLLDSQNKDSIFKNSIINKLFEPSKTNSNICKYLEYTYYRYKVDREYKLQQNDDELIDYIFWYLDGYSQVRKPLHTPISELEVSFLNRLIRLSLANFRLTNFHLNALFRENNLADLRTKLSDKNLYANLVYNFVTVRCLDNNMEFAIPDEYKLLLKEFNELWSNREFGLNRFVEIDFNLKPKYHLFNLHNDSERLLFYVYYILDILIEKPNYIIFVPQDIIKKVIYQNFDGENLLQKLVKKLFSENEDIKDMIEAFSYKNIKTYFLIKRIDIDTQETTTCYNGNRAESFRFVVPFSLEEEGYDIQVIGPFEKSSGLGQATRLSAEILERAGYKVYRVDFDLDNPAPEGFNKTSKISKLPKKAKINLIHLNAESIPLAIAYMPDVFTNAYNIGYFFWELDSPAKCHYLGMELVDEIWVASEYGVKQYQPFTDKPVYKAGMAYEDVKTVSKEEAKKFLLNRYGIPEDKFVFLATFDSFSFIQRKNPLGVIKAFKKAFPNKDDVVLVLKTHNRHRVFDPAQIKIWNAVDRYVSEDKRIILINETLTYEDLMKLKKGADCYVSLHRSEGWGFGIVEAMNLGVPVIATAYSANLEVCNEENSWLVDYEETFLNQDDYIFVIPGQKWAEPKIESAAGAMREVYENKELREQKAKKAQEFLRKNFSIDAIAKRYKRRIEEILKEVS